VDREAIVLFAPIAITIHGAEPCHRFRNPERGGLFMQAARPHIVRCDSQTSAINDAQIADGAGIATRSSLFKQLACLGIVAFNAETIEVENAKPAERGSAPLCDRGTK